MSDPKKHHYVPQLYLRQFCRDDKCKKVQTLGKHGPFLINKPSAIESIGYEDDLYKVSNKDITWCIEEKLNKKVETPISQSKTWHKILEGNPGLLDQNDKFILYIFCRHLEYRNLEKLEFIKSEHQRFNDPMHSHDYVGLEKKMHEEIKTSAFGVEEFFLKMADDLERYSFEYPKSSITILRSNIELRTSTSPVITVPNSVGFGTTTSSKQYIKWLPLSKYFGALVYINHPNRNLLSSTLVSDEVARVLNRLYVVQLLKTPSVRHMIHTDAFFEQDLDWAGLKPEKTNPKKYRVPET